MGFRRCTGADPLVTRYFVGDLWALVTSTESQQQQRLIMNSNQGQQRQERQDRPLSFRSSHEYLRGVMQGLEPDLEMVSKGIKAQQQEQRDEEEKQLFALVSSQQQASFDDSKNKNKRALKPTKTQEDLHQSSFLRIDEMLKGIYEDRIAQGILPICWACLPKTEANNIGSNEMVSANIRSLTRQVIELKPLARKNSRARQSSSKMDHETDKLL
uniref:Uncharacterized protein n=1 Tax=Entomoneis paludosa TaxID=265537 RepID=A0A7S2V8D2_9STRA